MTVSRVQVLAARLANRVLSHHDIEDMLGAARLDRVTLYPVLDGVVEAGLAHRIAGPDRMWCFPVTGEANETHAYFQCTHCGKVLCLDELSARKLAVRSPRGCRPERMELAVTVLCPLCPNRKQRP